MQALTIVEFIEVNNRLADSMPPCRKRDAFIRFFRCGGVDHTIRTLSQEELTEGAIRRVMHWVKFHAPVQNDQEVWVRVVDGKQTVSADLYERVCLFERSKASFLKIRKVCTAILALRKGAGSTHSFVSALQAAKERGLLTEEQVEVLKMNAQMALHFNRQHSILDATFQEMLVEGANALAADYFREPLPEKDFLMQITAPFVTCLDLSFSALNEVLPISNRSLRLPCVKKITIGAFRCDQDLSQDPFIALCTLIDYEGRSDQEEIELVVVEPIEELLKRAISRSFPNSRFEERSVFESMLFPVQEESVGSRSSVIHALLETVADDRLSSPSASAIEELIESRPQSTRTSEAISLRALPLIGMNPLRLRLARMGRLMGTFTL